MGDSRRAGFARGVRQRIRRGIVVAPRAERFARHPTARDGPRHGGRVEARRLRGRRAGAIGRRRRVLGRIRALGAVGAEGDPRRRDRGGGDGRRDRGSRHRLHRLALGRGRRRRRARPRGPHAVGAVRADVGGSRRPRAVPKGRTDRRRRAHADRRSHSPDPLGRAGRRRALRRRDPDPARRRPGEAATSLGAVRGMPALAVRRSALRTVLRSGVPGARRIGGNELFDVRTRLSQRVRTRS